MTDKETRSVSVGLRIFPSLKAALDKAASEDQRPVASMVEKILTEYLKAKGFLKK